jgi:hypothetical protein
MDDMRLEIGEVNLTIMGCGGHGARAERIGKLIFDRLQELMERELQHLGADVTLARLAAAPILVSLDTMDDEAVARACAEGVCRALSAAV